MAGARGVSSRLRQVILATAFVLPAIARAQGVSPELRVDVITAQQRTVVELGAGFQLPAGSYARIGVIGAVGADVTHGGPRATGRVDVIGRFLFDPFRQNQWGLSAGAGVSVRSQTQDYVRPYLVAIIDLEGPRHRGVSPAIQLGLGGGVRIGAAFRWAAPEGR